MTTPKTIKSIKKLYYSIFDILEKYQYLDNCTIKRKARYFIKEYQIDKKYYNYYYQKKNAKKYSLTDKKNRKTVKQNYLLCEIILIILLFQI